MQTRSTLRHVLAVAVLAPAVVTAQRVTKEGATRAPTRPSPNAPRPVPRAATTASAPAAGPAAATAAAKSLSDADVAFGARASSAGLRDALLATLADNSVLFQPRAINGRTWATATSVPTGQYTWTPAWAAASAGGDFGITSGPIVYRSTQPDSTSTGQYLTVWSKAGTAWKALLQLTVPGPQQVGDLTFAAHVPAGDGRPRGGPGAADGSRATLFIADRGMAAAALSEGAPAAIGRLLLPDARVLRGGRAPAIGIDSARAALVPRDPSLKYVWQTGGDVFMARSGDVGVTFGLYELRNAAGAAVEWGNFVRVWERQADGGWRILVDAAAPGT